MCGNPFFLIKARMQAYSPTLPVGTQHHYKSSWDALSSVWRAERFRGLIRGMDAAVLRTSMGSSVSLPVSVVACIFELRMVNIGATTKLQLGEAAVGGERLASKWHLDLPGK